MHPINKIINSDHKIIWQSENLNTLDEVEIISMTESHDDDFVRYRNALLIDKIVKRCGIAASEILVLAEVDKTKDIDAKACSQTALIRSPVKCSGWDIHLSELEEKELRKRVSLQCDIEEIMDQFTKLQSSLWSAFAQSDMTTISTLNHKLDQLRSELTKLVIEFWPDEKEQIQNENCCQYVNKFYEQFSEKYLANDFQLQNNSLIDTLEKT